jgi:hypothetical protein
MDRAELLEQARAQYGVSEVAEASLTCVRLAELSRAAGDAATLADAAVVIRRPLDPVVRARVLHVPSHVERQKCWPGGRTEQRRGEPAPLSFAHVRSTVR